MSRIFLPESEIRRQEAEESARRRADERERTRSVCDCPKVGVFEPGGGEQPEVEEWTGSPTQITCVHCGGRHWCFDIVIPTGHIFGTFMAKKETPGCPVGEKGPEGPAGELAGQ